MAILTNFLKLLKPEKNDYVDVDKHISENYDKIDNKMQELSTSNSGKLDKGAVSTEYDTAKKIEDKIKAVQSTADNKLDKDKYNGTAQTLKNDINGKVSKSGDTMTGILKWHQRVKVGTNEDTYGKPVIIFDNAGDNYFGIGANNAEQMTIRYGAANLANDSWIDINNNFVHKFDGNIKVQGDKDILHTGSYVTVGNNSSNNIYFSGDVNTINKAGIYYINSKATNRPFNTEGALIHCPWVHSDNKAGQQLFIHDTADYIAIRDIQHLSWKKIYPDDNKFVYSYCSYGEYIYNKGNAIQKLTLDTYKCLVPGIYQILATYETQEATAEIKVGDKIIYTMDGDIHETNTLQALAELKLNDVVTFTQRYSSNINVTFIRIGE